MSYVSRCFCLFWTKAYIGQALYAKTLLPPAKNTQLHTLFISPDDYDTTVNRKENGNVLMFLMFLHFTEAATRSCSLKKVFTTCGQKTLECFRWLWLLTIINFITEQPFVKHPFLKYTSPCPLLTSKFIMNSILCSVTIRFACCRRYFPVAFCMACKMMSLAKIMKQPLGRLD